ncbi:hypothetical protein Tco_1361582 [Tanacetum coccineum]
MCEFCEIDARYGHYYTPQVPIISNLEPCYDQDYDEFPQTLPSFPQQYPCCEDCGGPHETFQCQPRNYYKPNPCYDSNYSGLDQIEPPQFLVIYQSPQEMSMEALQAREDLMKSIENFLKKFNRISFRKTPKVLMQAWDKFLEIKHAQSEDVQELLNKLLQDLQSINEELAEFINTPSWNLPTSSYDDDDDEYSFATQEYLMTYSTAITPESSVTNSLIIEDEHLDTIPETESDELIKSSVEDLNHDLTFSNPLFDILSLTIFTSRRGIFPKRTVPNENFKIFSNPLFDLNEEITSTKVDQIDDEVLENTNSIPPGIEYPCFNAESDLLESLLHRDTSINDSQNIDSVLDEFAGKLTLLHSIPPGIDDVNLDPKGDILFFGEFALNITLLLALPERI